jgi:membrane protein implicated in regulation of membrane protease activity
VDLNSPDTWRWIWLVAALLMLGGELSTAGAFFFMPFAIGAIVAGAAAFAGISLGIEWLFFVGTSAATFAVLFPLGRRLDRRGSPEAIGAGRWVGREGVVLEEIPSGVGATGLVRLEREQWRAESLTGAAIRPGSEVLVLRVHGTRLVVAPTTEGED